ncbi:MAG: 2-oxoacid:ferredoxin oxidoreductase subunit beta [Firmicutes bacterium]|jgi:2-oxoglutarate ferredoxin oxidoreductase subunit beta|nr:2-oxoacid:ferredoxin oxidoreductase subunit beta [Bacillota bacterium]
MASIQGYLRRSKMPHIWCAGCGHGIVMGCLIRAIDRVGLDKNRTVIVSGIGCSSRAPGYMDFDTLHTTHGRALAFATGVKMANPSLNVIVIAGDGDLAAIGGNHLIHAARRNIRIATVCFDNSTYGMTSGQYSPMTPTGKFASTAPYGNIDRPFDLCELAKGAGATYVARGTTYHASLTVNLIAKALEHNGFAFVDVLSQCPTYYGRRNKLGGAVEMMKWYKDNAVPVQAARQSPEPLPPGRFMIGELFTVTAPEYTDEYAGVLERARERETRA